MNERGWKKYIAYERFAEFKQTKASTDTDSVIGKVGY